MDNNELLSQIKSLMAEQTEQLQKQMEERFAEQDQRIEKRFTEQDQRIEKRFAEQDLRIERLEKHVQQIDEKMEAQRKEQRRELIDMMETQTQKLSIIIENGISKRIDALFDARDISLAKDKELEDRTQTLEKKVDDVQNRVTVLESKIASAT